jgi:hypothetical protein
VIASTVSTFRLPPSWRNPRGSGVDPVRLTRVISVLTCTGTLQR